jgi:mono/diheme cytochrome c family protein
VPSTPRENLRLTRRVAIFTALFLIGLMTSLSIRNWVVYEQVRKRKNPVALTSSAIESGRELYGEHCQKCHGANGDGKGPKADELSVSPGDFTDAKRMGGETDGELFWRISKGRYPMPAFEGKVSEDERWQLVDYIRTFRAKPNASSPGGRP